ncbi:MAG: hypothetical protein NXI20_17830 [bacterium]|nr:hypothetical protein [bacterium]
MIIEYLKDCKDKRPNRSGNIEKGKRLIVTKEFGEEEINAKRARDISKKETEFLEEIMKKHEGEQ